MQSKQLDFLGWSLLAVIALVGAIVVTLAKIKLKLAGPGGVNFEAESEGTPDE